MDKGKELKKERKKNCMGVFIISKIKKNKVFVI